MAELKNTVVSGSLAAKKIYEGGTAIDSKFATKLEFNNNKLELKNSDGTVISSANMATGSVSITGATIATSGNGIPLVITEGFISGSTKYISDITMNNIILNSLTLSGNSKITTMNLNGSSSVTINAASGTKTVYNTWQLSEDSNGSIILKKA